MYLYLCLPSFLLKNFKLYFHVYWTLYFCYNRINEKFYHYFGTNNLSLSHVFSFLSFCFYFIENNFFHLTYSDYGFIFLYSFSSSSLLQYEYSSFLYYGKQMSFVLILHSIYNIFYIIKQKQTHQNRTNI